MLLYCKGSLSGLPGWAHKFRDTVLVAAAASPLCLCVCVWKVGTRSQQSQIEPPPRSLWSCTAAPCCPLLVHQRRSLNWCGSWFPLFFCSRCNFAFFSPDHNYGKWGSSKDIPGFSKHPPLPLGAKNRELRVSWGRRSLWNPRRLRGFGLKWKMYWGHFVFSVLYDSVLNFFFSRLPSERSFDTESEESRCVFYMFWGLNQCWFILQVQFVPSVPPAVKPRQCFSCSESSPCVSATPPTLIPLISKHHVTACRLLPDFYSAFSKLSHQPVLLFLRDPYLLSPAHGEPSCLLKALLVDRRKLKLQN